MEEQNVVKPPVEPSITTSELKQSPSILMSILGILLIFSLGAVAYLGFQNMQLTKQIAELKATSGTTVYPSASPVVTADLTADWEIYNSISSDYLFKHPTGLKSDTTSAGTGFESIRFTYIGPVQTASGRTQTELFDGYFFSITNMGPLTQFDPKTEASKQQQNSKESCSDVSEVIEVMINRLSAFKYGCPNNYDLIFVTNGKNTYSITQFYAGDNLSNYKRITDQILSTFKFTQ